MDASANRSEAEMAKSKREANDQLSYSRLVNYYNTQHPMKTVKDSEGQAKSVPFGICDTLGGHDFWCCCRSEEVSDMSKEIGVGATLFLMSTKSLAVLFFFLTLINIPVYMFYFASHPASQSLSTPQDYFNALSLGNIGSGDYACAAVNWAVPVVAPAVQEITLACATGTLTDVKYLGVPKSDKVTCKNLLVNTLHIKEKLEDECYTDFDDVRAHGIHSAKGHSDFVKFYADNCLGKASCTIPLGGPKGIAKNAGLKPECQTLLEQRWYHSASASPADKATVKAALASKGGVKDAPVDKVEPWMLAMTQCRQEMVTIDVTQLNKSLQVEKADFGIVVVFIDFLCVFIFIFFTFFLEKRQREYANNFEEQTITMSDFTLELANLPRDGYFNGKEQVLRTMLWDHLEHVMDDQHKVDHNDEGRSINCDII